METDEKEDGGGGGEQDTTAGSRPDPGQGSQETHLAMSVRDCWVTPTHLGGEAGLGQFVVQSEDPGHQSDGRPDDGGPVTSENSSEDREEETGRVLGLDQGHPRHDLSHPLQLLDTPEEAEHNRLIHQLEDTVLRREK